jgi:hypothetical protein
MKTILALILIFASLACHAANPSFQQFVTNDFTVVDRVSVSLNTNTVARLTNGVLEGPVPATSLTSTIPAANLNNAVSTGQLITNATLVNATNVGALFANDGKRMLFYSTSPVQGFLLGAGNTNASGNFNLGIGYLSLRDLTSGTDNTAIGSSGAAISITSGTHNTLIGSACGTWLTSGSHNTALGSYALNGVGGTSMINSTAIGKFALSSLTNGDYNVAVGSGAARPLVNGRYNTIVGGDALRDGTNVNESCAFGLDSLMKSQESYNSAFGTCSLQFMTTGTRNAAFGYNAGTGLLVGNSNVLFGTQTALTNGSGNIIIGIGTDALGVNATNQLNIGNLIFASGLTNGVSPSQGMVGIGVVNPVATLEVSGSGKFNSLTNNGQPVATYGGATSAGRIAIYNGASGLNGATKLNSDFAGNMNAASIKSETTITPTNGVTLPPIAAYAGPVCTNGLAHTWNSNGVVLLRVSAIGATTWSEVILATP